MKRIMIIGAGFLQTYVIKRAAELGYTTVVVDKSENAVGFKYATYHKSIDIVDMEACLEYAKEMQIDGVLTAATDYGVLTAAYIAEQMGLRGTSFKSAKLVKNKYSVHRELERKNVSDVGQFFEISDIDELNKIEDKIVYPVIIKPCDASGSRGVHRIDSKELLRECVTDAINNSLTHKVLIETFVDGNEYGVESYVCDGKVYVLAVMKKSMTEAPFYAELGHSLPSGLPREVVDRFIKQATDIITAIGINNSSVNMDFILSKDNIPYMVDIGARMGGNLIGSHIIPYSTGIDYMGNMIKSAVGDMEDIDFTSKTEIQITTGILNLEEGAVVKTVPMVEEIYEKFNNVRYVTLNFSENDVIPKYRTNLDGCGYVVIEGDDYDENTEIIKKVKEYINKKIKGEV